jgi:hypothetical protein
MYTRQTITKWFYIVYIYASGLNYVNLRISVNHGSHTVINTKMLALIRLNLHPEDFAYWKFSALKAKEKFVSFCVCMHVRWAAHEKS